MITLKNVWKTIGGKQVLRGINLTVKPGEIRAYLGHNGAGKTTTFRLILGILVPDSGKVEVLGVNPLKNPGVRVKIGYLPEYDLLYPNLTVFDNLRRYALLKGVYDEKELRELIEFFELEGYAKKKVSALSSGTQRRVAMARAFLGSPEVLILDEPTRGLDPGWRLKFKRFLKEYTRENNASVIFSTHILSDVDEVCESVTVIKKGEVFFSGCLRKFKEIAPSGETVLVKVAEVGRAVEVLREKGYSPEVVDNFIVLKKAKPAEVNALLVKAGLKVEEVRRNEPSLEEVYTKLHSRSDSPAFRRHQ
ncbi:ABC transporter ATP-binding protein [Thermococcus sp.]